MDLALSEYHIIILNHHDDQYTVLTHHLGHYAVRTLAKKMVLRDVTCLWDKTTMDQMIGAVELQKRAITDLLKKFTGVRNLSKCYFVWGDNFKNGND